jgi:RNA polymerase sigma-70 factor (ECF subfamily)
MLVVRQVDADDVMQEASVALWTKFGEYDSQLPFLPWAKRIVFLEVLNLRRRQKTSPLALSDSVIEQLAAEDSRHDEVLAAQREVLNKCVEKLGPQDRRLLDARYGGETSLVAFAESVGRSVHSMYVILSRIRKQLLECVNRALRAEGLI